MTTSDKTLEDIINAFEYKIDVKPKILIPKLIIRHLVFDHVCKDGWTYPHCALWNQFYYECFDNRLAIFKYKDERGQIFAWNIVGFDGDTEKESPNYIGVWPD